MPVADHHKHLISQAAAEWSSDIPAPAVVVPPEIARLLSERAERWDDSSALAELYREDAILLEDREFVTRGSSAIAEFIASNFGRPHRITPIAFVPDGRTARVAGYFTRDTETGVRHIGHVLLSLSRENGGAWRIASEAHVFPGPFVQRSLDAEQLVEELDAARLERALVLSVAYWFGSGSRDLPIQEEYARVLAENDWTAAQAAQYPERLVAFCSFNPLRVYALEELERCAAHPLLKGVKLHFGNSRVDLHDAEHVETLRRIFRAANHHRLPIAVHLYTGREYENAAREHAEIILNRLLPEVPDVPVQIAHFAGGGPGYTDAALSVYAEAVAAGDLRTRNLYFDLATVAERQGDEILQTLAQRIRQIGPDRVVWGTDLSPPNPAARQAWLSFRGTVPLTDEEFSVIAGNIAPYLR